MEELLLWRWSTAVQISSAALVALFFLVFARSTGRRELQPWVLAWACNALALAVTWAFWFWQPEQAWASMLLLVLYMASKTAFVLLLLLGVGRFAGLPWSASAPHRWAAIALLFGLLAGLQRPSVNVLGVVQSSLIALVLALGALVCLRHWRQGLGWLAAGFLLRAALGVAEAAAYGWRMLHPLEQIPSWLNIFLASHSSFDTGAEWVIVLGCVLAMAHRAVAELERSHAELHTAHDELHEAHAELRRVAERDPLTGLYNRRMLAQLSERAASPGSVLLFFDLDRFKQINDRLGHEAGDACLKRFAAALQQAFPDALALLRFAGDEFLALLPAAAAADLERRIEGLRADLQVIGAGQPALEFSVGRAEAGGAGEALVALRQADLAMYRDKSLRRERAAS